MLTFRSATLTTTATTNHTDSQVIREGSDSRPGRDPSVLRAEQTAAMHMTKQNRVSIGGKLSRRAQGQQSLSSYRGH